MGAILSQTDEQGKQRVISYSSKQLAKQEKNYTPFLEKMATMIWTIERFDKYLISQCSKTTNHCKHQEKT
jgi:hypothetical protein